ncbi:MAG: hypothetical protein CMH28_08810 [Micavibrio sp.]|nr:hypothetical protein [Micavibrio sp.]
MSKKQKFLSLILLLVVLLFGVASVAKAQNLAEIRRFIREEFRDHREFMLETFWEDNVLPALMKMTEQLSASQMAYSERQASFTERENEHSKIVAANQHVARTAISRRVDTEYCALATSTKPVIQKETEADAALSSSMTTGLSGSSQTVGSAQASQNLNVQNRQNITCQDVDPSDEVKKAFCNVDTGTTEGGNSAMNADVISMEPDANGALSPEAQDLVNNKNFLFTTQLPDITADTYENESTQLALSQSRPYMAQQKMAEYCYTLTMKNRMVMGNAEPTPEQIAAREAYGMSAEEAAAAGVSARTIRDDQINTLNSAAFGVGQIGPESNALRSDNVIAGMQASDSYYNLQLAQCYNSLVASRLGNKIAEYNTQGKIDQLR